MCCRSICYNCIKINEATQSTFASAEQRKTKNINNGGRVGGGPGWLKRFLGQQEPTPALGWLLQNNKTWGRRG